MLFSTVQTPNSAIKEKNGLSNAQRCKLFRERLKQDPERFEIQKAKDLARWKRLRELPITEEQLRMKREKGRIRAQKFR